MKTALTQFLELLEDETEEYYRIINDESNYFDEDISAAKSAVTNIEALLVEGEKFVEMERKQIESAFDEGKENYNEDSQDSVSAETYYAITYTEI